MTRGLPRAQSRGFSMVEIIITIALLALLVALGLFMSMEAYRGATRRSERDVIVSMLERARSRAMANIDESEWSVCYDDAAEDYVISKHPTTCDDSTAYDRVEANAVVVADSDMSELTKPNRILFERLTGNVVAASPTEIEITVRQASKEEPITINYEGRINW